MMLHFVKESVIITKFKRYADFFVCKAEDFEVNYDWYL